MVTGIFWYLGTSWVVVGGGEFILGDGGRRCVYFGRWWVVVGLFLVVLGVCEVFLIDGGVIMGGCGWFWMYFGW